MSDELQKKLDQLRQAHEAGLLDDETYQASADSLRAQYVAQVQSGAAAQGDGATAVGERGVLVEGSVSAPIVTGIWTGNYIVGDPDTDPEKLRTAYLNYILHTCGQLSLSGIDPRAASEAKASLNLGAVYTALLTRSGEESDLETQMKTAVGGGSPKSHQLSALAAFDQHPHLVLLGGPGSGKSTFINFIALCLAGEQVGRTDVNIALLTTPLPADDEYEQHEQKPQPWQHGPLLPVRVILRDLAARGLPLVGQTANAAHLWEFIAAELDTSTLDMYTPHLHQELQEKGGVILLDGLDEVPEANARRVQIKEMVVDFAAAFPRCRLLITSRTYAYQKQDWRLPDFKEVVLAPFSRGQIRNFVNRWYAHIAGMRGLNTADAQGRAELLNRAIFASDRLQDLAEQPLLLTLMASLHAWRGGSLTEKREQLYADTVDLLLDWWEKPKLLRDEMGNVTITQPSLAEWLKVDRNQVRELLNRLAYEVHARQIDLRDTADIAQADLVSGLLTLSQNPDVKPLRLIEYLIQRAGLLVPRGLGVYTFPHRTIQEYLAACYLTDEEFPDKLSELARNDPNRWREVTLLAGAKASRGSATNIWTLAEALCYEEPGQFEEPGQIESNIADLWGAQLAGQALAETADLQRVTPRNQAKLDRTRNWLVHILRHSSLSPVERALAGVNLARLEDPRPEIMTLDGMIFSCVPPGPFWMGSESRSDEKPLHQVDIPYPYFMGRFPVTQAQYAFFVEAGGYKNQDYWLEARRDGIWKSTGLQEREGGSSRDRPFTYGAVTNLPNHPVIGVSWYEALAFTRWLTNTWREAYLLPSGWELHLPSESEWEKAARGGQHVPTKSIEVTTTELIQDFPTSWDFQENENPQRLYPWGNDLDLNYANYRDSGIGQTSGIGAFPLGRSPYKCEELGGNVLEWTRSQQRDYPYRSNDGREREELVTHSTLMVFRGGSYMYGDKWLRCSARLWDTPYSFHFGNLGFRLVIIPSSVRTTGG